MSMVDDAVSLKRDSVSNIVSSILPVNVDSDKTEGIAGFVQWLARSYGHIGMFSIALIDSAGVPTMGGPEASMMLVAFESKASIVFLAIVGAVGAVLGTIILYRVGFIGGEWALYKCGVSQERYLTIKQKFRRNSIAYGLLLGLALPPVPKKALTVVAGAAQVSIRTLVITVFLGRWIRYILFGIIGREYGREAMSLFKSQSTLMVPIVLVSFISCIIVVVGRNLMHRRRARITARTSRNESTDSIPEVLQVLL